jgi:hypothetical protein
MTLQRNLSLRQERSSNTTTHLRARLLSSLESLRLTQEQTEDDNKNRRTSRKPIKRPPSVRGRINERASKSRGKEVSKSIALLQETRDNTTRLGGTVLERGGSCITIQTTHGDTEEGATGQELFIGLAEAGA